MLSAAFFAEARARHPEIDAEIGEGKFSTLHGWLRQNVYRFGRQFTPAELVEKATGAPMKIEPYVAYLEEKFGTLYGL